MKYNSSIYRVGVFSDTNKIKMKVVEINKDKNLVHEILDIDERRVQLFVARLEMYLKDIERSLDRGDNSKFNITTILSSMTSECVSVNEIGLYCYVIGREVNRFLEGRRNKKITEMIKKEISDEIDMIEKIEKSTRNQNSNLN